MPKYEITGKGKDTGRKRRRTYFARNEIIARQLAEKDGTVVEEVVELPPPPLEPPTEKQLEFAKELGISIPPNTTKDDLSFLITLKVDRDKPATERHMAFAEGFGINVADRIGKKGLFNWIHHELSARGRESELLSWFAFRVYRGLTDAADDAPIQGPDHPIIQGIAKELENDQKILGSVRRYEGKDLIWFGEWTAPSGVVVTGGSNRTLAYKQISSMLRERAGLPEKPQRRAVSTPSATATSRPQRAASESRGCLSVIALAVVVPVGIYAAVVWLGEMLT